MTTARKHHFVPAAYLGIFAKPATKHGRLYAFDVSQQKSWTTAPVNHARETDLYRVAGPTPDALEKLLSQIEGELIPAVQRIEAGSRTDDDFRKVLAFVGLQSIRGPEQLRRTEEIQNAIADGQLAMVLSSKERFESTVAKMKKVLPDVDTSPTWESMREAFSTGKLRPRQAVGRAATTAISLFKDARSLLEGRETALMFGEPVLCTSTEPIVFQGHTPTIGMADAVMMALSPRLLFVSIFTNEEKPANGFIDAPPLMFEMFNALLAYQSRQIFGTKENVTRCIARFLTAPKTEK